MANIKAKFVVSIDLTKIDKTKIQKTDKDGNPYRYKEGFEPKDANGNILRDKNGNPLGPQYYSQEIIVFDEVSQYGSDVMVTEGQTKEERDNKVKSKTIGNGKTVYTANPQPQQPAQTPTGVHPSMQQPPQPPPIPTIGGDDDDLPF